MRPAPPLLAALLQAPACTPPPPCEVQATAAAMAFGMEGGDHRCLAGTTLRVEDGRLVRVDPSTAACPVDVEIWRGIEAELIGTRVSGDTASCQVPLLKDATFGTTSP